MTTPPDYCLCDAAGNKWSGHRMPRLLAALVQAYLNNSGKVKWGLRECKTREQKEAMMKISAKPPKTPMLVKYPDGFVVGKDGPWQDENAGLKGFD